MGGIIQTPFNGGRKIKALQSYRTDLGNDFAYSNPNVHFQSNSYRLSFRAAPAKQLSSERAPLKQQNKVTLTAEIKPISKQRVITQMWISRFFLFSDLMRLESLHTPHTLTHPRALTRAHVHLHTRVASLEKGGSGKSSHLTLYWNSRSVRMEKQDSAKPTRLTCRLAKIETQRKREAI